MTGLLPNLLEAVFLYLESKSYTCMAAAISRAKLSPLIAVTRDKAKRMAAAGPFAVTVLPSTSTGAAVKSAPSNIDSKPG